MTTARRGLFEVPRSCLVVPAIEERKIEKALASAADEVVLDLEDAVERGSKDRAREMAVAVIAGHAKPGGAPRLAVRINQVGTPWCHLDVLAVAAAAAGPLTIVVPKVEQPTHLAFVDHLLTGALGDEQQTGSPDTVIGLDALVESAAGIRALDSILASSRRLRAVIIGYADLGADIGVDLGGVSHGAVATRAAVRTTTLLAARAAGRFVVDGPWLSVRVDGDFIADRTSASEHGLDGSWAIHPDQLQTLNELYSPTSDDLAWAQRVIATLAGAVADGMGAVALDGQMLDEAVAVRARRILERAGVSHE